VACWYKGGCLKYLIPLLLFALPVHAANRTLTGDCVNLPAVGSPPTEASPYDLDGCTIIDGDDITGILTGAVSRWGSVALRAPSSTKSVTSNSTAFTGHDFFFLEDQSALNRLTITHAPSSPDSSFTPVPGNTVTRKQTMWGITNANRVVIGGAKLSMTFVGTHPGLGVGNNDQIGLISFDTTNGSTPDLADIRANFRTTYSHGIYFEGGQGIDSYVNRFEQVNVAGVFWSSGVAAPDGGVRSVWLDPDRTVIMDPFVRALGWSGAADFTDAGNAIGCAVESRAEYRVYPQANFQYPYKVSGGVTLGYGFPNANIFVGRYIGNSQSDPYLVRFHDIGHSGPSTGYPAGVMVKKSYTLFLAKYDPMDEAITARGSRFVRMRELPSNYGIGVFTYSSPSCANFAGPTSQPGIWFAEASSDGSSSPYVTAHFDVAVQGLTQWKYTDETWGPIIPNAGGSCDNPAGGMDKSYNHRVYVPGGSTIPGTTRLVDRITVAGPGTVFNLIVESILCGGATYVANGNIIENVRVSGAVTIGTSAGTTTVTNTHFTGTTSDLITVGSGSTVNFTNLCIASGKRVVGAGTANYEGTPLALPYTFGTLNECSLPADGTPNPPSGGSVN
jgi:hypothetical protein